MAWQTVGQSIPTPFVSGVKLCNSSQQSPVDRPKYQAVIGSLLHLSLKTRPDIAFAVGSAARFCSNPDATHWTAVKRILRYLKGTSDLGIKYQKEPSNFLHGYADADWAGDIDDRKSTSGYCFMMSGGAVSWSSKKQSCVALSTAESEYLALSSATQEALWLRHIMADMGEQQLDPTPINEDNQAAIMMSKNFQFHGRAKHIAIRYHFIHEHLANGNISLIYCPSDQNLADIFTKCVQNERFVKFRTLLGIC